MVPGGSANGSENGTIEIAIDLNKKTTKLPLHRTIVPLSFGLVDNLESMADMSSSNQSENVNKFEEGKSIILVDPSLEEENLPPLFYSPLTIMVDENGKICCIEKRSGNVNACNFICVYKTL